MLSLLKHLEPTHQSVVVNVRQNFWTQMEECAGQPSDLQHPIFAAWMKLRMTIQSVANRRFAAPKYQALTCGLSHAHMKSILVEPTLLRLS